MKKLLSIMLALSLVFTLAACGGRDTPEEIIDCLTDPDGEGCPDINIPVVCETGEVLVDGECVVPDPTCATDEVLVDGICVYVDPNPDITCETGEVLVDGVCVVPDPTCATGEVLVAGVCVIVDTRTPEEILADSIVANWDGEFTHIDLIMDNLDTETSMEFTTEFNLAIRDVFDSVLETKYFNAIITDNYLFEETGTTMHRFITVNIDGEIHFIEFIFEEVATGVIVYINIEDLVDFLNAENPDVTYVLNTLGVSEDWLMFRFDDTLDNLIELEIAKEMIIDIFFLEFGDNFFYDLQNDLDDRLELLIPDLITYGVDIGLFVDHVLNEDFVAAELLVENIDYELLIFDLDAAYLVPEIVQLLTDNAIELDLAGFPTATKILLLNDPLTGTEAFLRSLTEAEISIFLDIVVDPNLPIEAPDLSDMYDAYLAGTLDHEIVMYLLNSPEVELKMMEIPGFDFWAFHAAMDALDYDAFYLEEVDVELLAQAIYEGQAEFDIFVAGLVATAPESASILAAWSGTVLELEQYMVIIDDINYALDNLFIFEDYFDIQYYLDNDMIVLDIEANSDAEIETTLTFDGPEYVTLFEDVIDDVYWYLDGFEYFEMPYVEHLNCPIGETCDDFPQYTEIVDKFAELGYVDIVVTYDPSDPGQVSTLVDFTDFADAFIQMNDDITGSVIDMSVLFTVSEDGAITIPTETANVNEIAQDFAKFSLYFMTYDFVRDAMQHYVANSAYYMANPLEFPGVHYFDDYDEIQASLAFDSSMSYITVGGTVAAPTISCTLFWADGTEVFDNPVTLTYLDLMMFDGPPAHVDYLVMLDGVDEVNWNLTKMIIVYLFADVDVN